MVGIPEGTEIHELLMSNGKTTHWEYLNDMARQRPKSRADRAIKTIDEALSGLTEIYPESKEKWPLIRKLICAQILGIEVADSGFVECKKKKLDDVIFEELKKL